MLITMGLASSDQSTGAPLDRASSIRCARITAKETHLPPRDWRCWYNALVFADPARRGPSCIRAPPCLPCMQPCPRTIEMLLQGDRSFFLSIWDLGDPSNLSEPPSASRVGYSKRWSRWLHKNLPKYR